MRSNITVFSRRPFAIATSALMLWLTAPAHQLPAEQARAIVPRYRLRVGQELIYRVTSSHEVSESDGKETATENGPSEQTQWHLTVVRENSDGSWRLFLRTQQALFNADGSERFKRDSFGHCDLRPDGSYALDEQTAIFKMLFPYELFCRLPDTLAEFRTEWTYQPPVYGIGLTYHVVTADGPDLQISAVQKSDYSDGRWQLLRRYEFDSTLGLAKTITRESRDVKSGRPVHRRTVSLIDETLHDAEWIAQFDEEGQRYLDANAKWMTLCYAGLRSRNLEDCRRARSEARAVLTAGRQQAEMDYFKELYDSNLQAHEKDENGHLEAVKNRERFFATTPNLSTTWEVKGLDGSTFRLADQRGKVVVLYFWSEGCEYCMLAASQISKVAADYKDRDVAVVGMFIRNDSADDDGVVPRHASTKAYRGFPHLEAKEVYELYRLRQFGFGTPSTLVLDLGGKVHEALSGYSADLGQCVRKVVDDLRGGESEMDRKPVSLDQSRKRIGTEKKHESGSCTPRKVELWHADNHAARLADNQGCETEPPGCVALGYGQ